MGACRSSCVAAPPCAPCSPNAPPPVPCAASPSQRGADAPRDLSSLGDDALLAITIENPGLDLREPQRYQSLVALTAPELDEAFEDYFRQSEQLPTRLLLAADRNGAAGLLLQKLPGDEGDEDGWARASALFETLGKAELLATPAEQLLHRLFHEEKPELMGDKPLSFACSCSRERVASMLQSLGEDEARAAAADTGAVEVRCEFCGREYHFPLTEFGILFHGAEGLYRRQNGFSEQLVLHLGDQGLLRIHKHPTIKFPSLRELPLSALV